MYSFQQTQIRHLYDPISGQMVMVRPRPSSWWDQTRPRPGMVGAAIPTLSDPPIPTPKEESYTVSELARAFKSVTPTLLLVGIATGFAFAVGAGLASRLLNNKKR